MILEADGCIGRDHVLLMTMFDYEPKYPWCKWDAPLDDEVHTGNDAIRDEAGDIYSSIGFVICVRPMGKARRLGHKQDFIWRSSNTRKLLRCLSNFTLHTEGEKLFSIVLKEPTERPRKSVGDSNCRS